MRGNKQREIIIDTPFLPVEGRVFIPGESVADDPMRRQLIGKALPVRALIEGIVFVDNPDLSGGHLAFDAAHGTCEPPLPWDKSRAQTEILEQISA